MTDRHHRAKQWLHEPLLHFLFIGVLLFVVYGWVSPNSEQTDQRIVVSTALVDDLARQYQTTRMRAPNTQELDGLVESYVRDEILYREGIALGLDRDDAVIKRRVRQKLEVIAEEQLARSAPSDTELSAYLNSNAARFSQPAVLSFEQITFDHSAHQTQLDKAISNARTSLARGVAVETLGQRTLLPQRLDQVPLDLIARDFGSEFAKQLDQLPLNEWRGPIESGLGAHLVRISERAPATLPPLESVRMQVAREWENEQRERSRTESYKQLRSRYQVVVEPRSSAQSNSINASTRDDALPAPSPLEGVAKGFISAHPELVEGLRSENAEDFGSFRQAQRERIQIHNLLRQPPLRGEGEKPKANAIASVPLQR
jgi:parvulin-like peptidyl-prolyl isomerase